MLLTINGRVEGAPDAGVSFSRVEAWSVSGAQRKPLGSTVADATGVFHIEFDEARLEEIGPMLAEGVVFRVLRDQQPLAEPERSPVWRPDRAAEEIAVPISAAEPVETHRLEGRLVDAADRRPLGGLVVRASTAHREGREELGSSLSDEDGRFLLVWPAEAGRSVHLEILSPAGDVVHEADMRARDSGRVTELRVPMPRGSAEESLEDVAAGSGLRIPRRLVRQLAEHGVTTIGELRTADLHELLPDADRRGLHALRGLAALSSLSTTSAENVELVRRGYASPGAIARVSRADFVEAAGDTLGDLRAGAVHAEARAQDAFLSNIVAGERAAAAYRSGAATPLAGPVGLAVKCSCEDCEAAVSPGAYLAELLRYALEHVEDDDTAITLSWLGSRLHQPLRDLPASCGSTRDPIRQIRICIEALRSHLRSVWSSVPQERRDALEEAEREYRLAVYERLLLEIGTSHEEIRLARTAGAAQRQALAERLGIQLEPARPDRLDQLLLEPTTLTEQRLEQRFGLKSTSSSDPLSPPPAGELKDWRSEQLRASWWASAWPTDPWTDEDAQPELPVVDPDLLTARDFRVPLQQNAAYAEWQTRTNWMNTRLGQLDAERVQNGLTAALQQVFGTPLPNLEQLRDNLAQGTDLTATRQQIADLELTEDSFVRLMEIRAEDLDPAAAPTDAEWQELNSILGQAEKRKQFATWIQDEQARGIRLTPEFFHLPLDDYTPPRWRGSMAERARWAEGLRRRSEPPVVDPDAVFPGDLRNPVTGDPVYNLWQTRRTWIDARMSSFMQRPRTRATLDAITRSTLGVTQAQLDRLIDGHRQRADIAPQLQRLTIDGGAFGHLVRVRDLIDSGGQITDDEWLGVSSVLTQVLKRRQFGEWRRMERLERLLLGPDRFRLQSDPLIAPALPEWRASERARGEWLDVLEARIEQDDAVAEAARAAVDEAEDFALPLLRDALIRASDAAGDDLAERAKWLADRLMIDTQAAACTKTTRVAQAIESIQQLLFQLRTDQLRDTYPNLVLKADRFDEEWEWLGSYATWRAAMFVLFYPENLLIPTLRRQQTPAFRKLVNELRANRRLSPSRARQYAQEHAQYYADVCSLYVEASCSANTRVANTGVPLADFRDLFYVFGRGRSGDVYLASHDFSDRSGYAQGFWSKIDAFDGVDVHRVIGAYADKYGDDRWLWLFARVRSEGEEKLVLTRMSLDKGGGWKELEDLDLPDEVTSFQAIAVQTNGPRPLLAILTREQGQKKFYLRRLAGSDWEEDDWTPLSLRRPGAPANDAPGDILSAVEIYGEWGICLFATYGSTVEALFLYPSYNPSPLVRNLSLGIVARWQGAFVLGDSPGPDGDSANPGDARIYGLWYDGFVTRYRAFAWPRSHNITSIVQSTNSFLDAAAANLAVPDGNARTPKRLAFRRETGEPGIYVARLDRFAVDGVLFESDRRPIAPQFPTPPDILEIFDRIRDPQQRSMLFSTTLPAIQAAFGSAANRVASNRTYLEEAYYFVPVQIALQLQQRGEYLAALDWFRTVYEYGSPVDERKIYYGLREEEQYAFGFSRAADWLLDPLNPHAIAATRRNTYTRFTLLSIVRCLLEFGDSEFTQDTAETIPRARALYTTALELLRLPELDQTLGSCDRSIGRLEIAVGGPEWVEVVRGLGEAIRNLGSLGLVEATVNRVNAALSGQGSWNKRLEKARTIVEEAASAVPEEPPIADALGENAALRSEWQLAVLRAPIVVETLQAVGGSAAADFQRAAVTLAGPLVLREDGRIPWLRPHEHGSVPRVYRDEGNGARAGTSYAVTGAGTEGVRLLGGFGHLGGAFLPTPVYSYCVPPNPLLRTLRLWAELNLFKLRNCMNIAGLEREFEPYAAPTDTETGLPSIGAGGQLTLPGTRTHRPTPYRYATLIERAKELARMASQFEASMLAAIQQGDQERYNRLLAQRDVSLARAGVRLQELRVREAEGAVNLAELQKQRAVIQATHYQELIEAGPTATEQAALTMLWVTAGLHLIASALSFTAVAFSTNAAGLAANRADPVAAAAHSAAASSAGASATSSLAAGTSTVASILSTIASWERRVQDWEFARALALQDTLIGDQQIRNAQDHVKVVNQERQIARMQTEHAEEVVDFLATKFMNVDMYDFMANVLQGVYSFFLQQATAMFHLAFDQLAFERQEEPPRRPRADYWEAPSEDTLGLPEDGAAPDRRGLTGSARLLQDVAELDQYAFETDRRKLQLLATISLARLAPTEFARFRQTGELRFNTTAEMFDRQFPGHYLRLIKRVRTTVVALIPPSTGIRATLARTGPSYAVVGGQTFQRVSIPPTGGEVALSSPFEDTGVFQLDVQPEMRGVFESEGLEGGWVFRMPKPANPFDFSTIADVLITFEYTALNSDGYRRQVIQSLGPEARGDRAFSFRTHFADQWYDLNNPDETATPMTVRFRTERDDFPPNLEGVEIRNVVLLLARKGGGRFTAPINIDDLRFAGVGGAATTSLEGIASSRTNALSWTPLTGKPVTGEWKLALSDDSATRKLFSDGEIADLLLVVSFSGKTQAWV